MGIILHSHLQPLFILFFLNMDINLNTEPEPEPELEISPEREREDDRIKPLWLGRRRSRRQTDEIKQMEGNTSAGPMHVDHQRHPQTLHQQHMSHNLQGSMVDPPICENFPMSVGNMHESEQPMGLMNYNKGDKGKICTSQDDKPSFSGSSCQRIKWTDEMAKLLINVVSCTGEERKSAILLKGKWKAVSQVMSERGFSVTSRQCEDKFHELNKRFKQLTDPLGWDNACKVVKNHALLGTMGHLSLKAKEAVWKSLSSKHLFFEEMSSYHNGNRLDLPYDPKHRISPQLALKRDDDHDSRNVQEDFNDDDSWTLDKHARHTSDSVRDRVPLAICGPILSGKSPPPDFPAEPYQFWVVNADQPKSQSNQPKTQSSQPKVQNTRKRGSSTRTEEEPVKKSKTDEEGLESSSGKDGEDLDDRLPSSQFVPKKLVKKKDSDVSSTVVGDQSGGKGAAGEKTTPKKNVPPSSKASPSGKGVVLSGTNVVVVMPDDDDNDEFFGPDDETNWSGGGEELKEPEIPAPEVTSPRNELSENVNKTPPDEGTVGSSVFTFMGPVCDSLGALTSSSFNSYSAAEMLKAVTLYGSATRDFLNLIAANQRLLEAAIREKELADMASLRVQLQREQERARGLETQLADAKAEQGRVKFLEEEIVQLKNNESQLNAKITNAEAATTELACQLAEAKEEYRTELAAKIKEGVKEFVDKQLYMTRNGIFRYP